MSISIYSLYSGLSGALKMIQYDHFVSLIYLNMNQARKQSSEFICVHIQNCLWCGLRLNRKKNSKYFNIWFHTAKQLNDSLYVPQSSLVFSSCFCPQSRRGSFPHPAASARTSGVTQLAESFQAKSSLTAETQLEATTQPLGTAGQQENSLTH